MFMSLEEVSRPDLDDPFSWARIARIHSDWLRSTAPSYGMDVPKLILGDVLASIVGDDENCFGIKAAGFRSAEMANRGKQYLLERLNWEIEVPELPENIRGQLEKVRQQLTDLDWSDGAGFNRARDIWTKLAKNFTQRQLALHLDLRQAQKYDLQMAATLSVPWQKYLYGKQVYTPFELGVGE